MAEWEEEFEEQTVAEVKADKMPVIEQESEDIIKPKVEYKPPSQEPKEDPNDYEKKWQEKNKDLIEKRRMDEKAVEGLEDKDKQKKLIDMRIISDVTDFMGGDKTVKKESIAEKVITLATEKDFIDLAVNNVSKVKAANKPSKFTFTYLKNSLDLLAPTLDGDKIDQLIKDLTVLFNKKRKEESEKNGKKPGAKAKPTVSAGKGLDRAEKMGAFEDFGGPDHIEDEDYYEDDFI